MRRERNCTRRDDLLRVGVDRRRLLADRELDARRVEDRAAARRDDDRLAVLALGHLPERRSVDPLQPDGAPERADEDESEDREQEANAPVGLLVGGAHYFFVRSTYP